MLQDLDFGHLDNKYRKATPNDNDIIIGYRAKNTSRKKIFHKDR